MSVLNTIQSQYANYTETHRKVADYISSNYSQMVFMTADDLAEAIGTSTTTIIRFARFLGFKGYSDFLQTIRSEATQKLSMPERLKDRNHNDTPRLEEAMELAVENIYSTATLLSKNMCGETVPDLLIKAKRVMVYGTCSMTGVAQYLTGSLRMLRDNVYQLSGVGGIYADEFLDLKKGDVLVTFLFPRYEFLLLKLLPILKERGVKIIIFTSTVFDSIKELGDAFVPCSVNSVTTRDSLMSIMFAIDYITRETEDLVKYGNMEKTAETMEQMVVKFYCGL